MSRYLSENQFEVYEQIGKGGFGVVYRGLDKVTKELVAIKQIDLEETDDLTGLLKEIKILKHCQLKQITRYHGCFIKGHKLWIIMELLDGGSCNELIHKSKTKGMDEKYIAILMREVLIALDYLHERGKIHRDIKAANILLNSQGDVKIADFGVSTELSNNLSRRRTFVGSPYWMSPEVILEEEYNTKADIWSLGITAIELAKGKPPLSNIPPMKALFEIPKNPPPELREDDMHPSFSNEFKQFVLLCLQKNPIQRPTAKKLLKTKFIMRSGKTSKLVDLLVTSDILSTSTEKPIPKYYVPTINNTLTNDNNSIKFDFDTIEKKVEELNIKSPLRESNVIITKKSPLGFKKDPLTVNYNLYNQVCSGEVLNKTPSPPLLKLSNHQKQQPQSDIFDLITTSITQLQQESNGKNIYPQEELDKLNQMAEIINSLKSTKVLSNLSTAISHSQANSPPPEAQSESASEKLLLKRWTDQYF